MYYLPDYARERVHPVYLHIFCVRLLQVCSFYEDGQFQGLNKRNGQQVRPHAFRFLNI